MNRTAPSAFQRAFPRRLCWQGPGKWVAFWSVIAALSLCGLLVLAALLADLLTTRGQATLSASEMASLRARLGDVVSAELPSEDENAPTAVVRNTGLLPTLAHLGDREPWASLLAIKYRAVPALRSNGAALSILMVCGGIVGILFTLALSRGRTRSVQSAMQIAGRHRTHLHRQSLRLGPGDLSGESRRSVHELFTTEIDRFRSGVARWLQSLYRDPLILILLLLMTLSVDWRLTLQCLVPLAASWWFVHRELSWGRQRRELANAQAESQLRLLAESLNKARIVRGYSMEEYEQQQFETHLTRFNHRVSAGLGQEQLAIWASRVLMVACVGLVLYLIAAKMLAAVNPLPVFAAVLLLLTFGALIVAAESLLRLKSVHQQISIAGDKVLRYLDRIPEVGQAVGAKFLEPVSKSITFESVRYRVGDVPVLNDFSLRIPAGTSTAIVSVDPLQAQAIAYLLPRFIEPQAGRVLFDSEDINWGTLESLRAETIYVGGSDPFFTGTVLENITCGHPRYGLPEATEAAKMVHAHKFVTRLPQGYETLLGEHGEQLAIGQAFLLGLARAALRKPAVLIIEEPLARLDDDTKALLDDAYNKLVKDRTVIFLPSRLSTVRRCDQVILVNNGQVEAVGSHLDLLKKSDVYRHWEYMTFNAFQRQEETAGRAAS